MKGLWIVAAFLSVAAGSAGAETARLPRTKTAADRKAWRALLHWPASCEDAWTAWQSDRAGVVIEPPSPSGPRLVQVTCDIFAGQDTFVLYLIDDNRRVTGPLRLPVYVEEHGRIKLVRRAGDYPRDVVCFGR